MRTARILLSVCLFVGWASVCWADQPECTGNRHYDECGDFCPMTTTTTVADPTTTTTLADDPGCPTPPPCPQVKCGDGDTTTYNVTVNRCPAMVPYVPCRYTHAKSLAKLMAHGYKVELTPQGAVACPKPHYHGRVLMPVS